MQLTKCYVQDFGKLHEFTLELANGLNTIKEQNGWGKSTLATFVKAILFGLPATTKKDIDENERIKYMPWNKTKFGGYVEFVLNNKPYRLERWFGAKSSQDSATLYDMQTNNVATDFTPNIMEEYFNINAETFERSTYISQGHINSDINDGLRAKLGNLLQNERENNFKRALEIVADRRKEKQLYRGKGGEIEDVRLKMDNLNLKIGDALNKKEQLVGTQKEYEAQKLEIENKQTKLAEIEKQIAVLDKQHAKNAEIEHYESIKQDLVRIKGEYEKDLAFFKHQIPDRATTQRIQAQINLYNEKQVQLASTLSNSDQTELDELQKFFGARVPTDPELDEYANKCAEIDKLEKQNFAPAQNIATTTPQFESKNYFVYFALVGIVAVVLGLCLGALANWIVGGIIAVLGLGCAIGGGVLWRNNKQKQQELLAKQNLDILRKNEESTKNQEKLQNQIEGLRNQVQNFVQMFLTPSPSLLFDLSVIRNKKDRLAILKKHDEQRKQTKNNLETELLAIKTDLDRFFAVFYTDFSMGYQNMLNNIDFKLNDIERIKKELSASQQKLQDYVKQKGIDEEQKITQTDIEKTKYLNEQKIILTNELSNLNTTHGQTLATIKSLSSEVDNIDIYSNELKALKEREKAISYEVEVLDNVKFFLEGANNALTSRYISPMTKNFKHYAKLLANETLEDVSINTDLDVQIEAQGAKRDKKYLSAGYRDIVDLCMRFALVDAIFPNEKPIIMLDDPFINLDEQNTQNGLKLIKSIAENQQIVYFACHSSRV